jgi:hypothetical protein
MEEAEAEGLTAAITESEVTMPVMPHLAFSPTDLDRYHPALEAPEAVDDPDLDDQTPDPVYEHGLTIAAEIEKAMVELGRTRKDAEVRTNAVEWY